MYREKEMYDYCGQLSKNSEISQGQFMMLARKFYRVMKVDHHVKAILLEIFHMWEITGDGKKE